MNSLRQNRRAYHRGGQSWNRNLPTLLQPLSATRWDRIRDADELLSTTHTGCLKVSHVLSLDICLRLCKIGCNIFTYQDFYMEQLCYEFYA